MKLLIVVPAFNEAAVLRSTISSIKSKTKSIKNKQILVIDDGSADDTFSIAHQSRVKAVRHILNRGLGASLSTGIKYARLHGFDIVVTIDADGQHDPADIKPAIQPIAKNKADVVIGSRTISKKGKIPFDRQVIIALSNFVTLVLFNQPTTDSLSGFRAFNKRAIHSLNLKTDRMEVSNEFFSEIKRLNLRLAEVPIHVIYTDYSRSKGQSNLNAVNVIYKLLLRLFR